ncbi:flagellar brake protein [Natronincola ferrireducens]|uniref:C-di-GMP-binding flagellar brake protein YcgR, contains PilZNR and PilZ domains n=1 Tax=Natronincola ferrireducens TaxID=393762 RepID=A0A1G9IUI5_9FIRM|nr:PilZ domain-containing protein [Natronincola ferrireducens]SDL28782.1 c-di-GMP-binding flagellar brake protein YcgR, contains PilZNR and PilZ domains [Natronincola ferrireducens]
MYGNYVEIGRKIKLEIDIIPPYLSFWGVISGVEEEYIVVDIEGEYIQKQEKTVKCTIPSDANICVFYGVIKGCIEGKLILMMPKPDEFEILQRRKYARVPTDFQVNCFLIGYNNKKINSNKRFIATVKDISGGGVLLSSELFIPIGTVLVFELLLNNDPLVLTVKVLRNIESTNNDNRDLGCEFIGLSHSDQQKIIAYTNKVQLKLKQKQCV